MHEKKEYRYPITVRIRQQMHFDVASYCNVLKTNEMHSSYNQFLFYMFGTNLVVRHQVKAKVPPITGY